MAGSQLASASEKTLSAVTFHSLYPTAAVLISSRSSRRAASHPHPFAMETKRGKEKRNQAACCVEPHGWCVVAPIGLKRHFGYDRAVLLIQATTVRFSNGPKPLSLHIRKVKWT